MKLILFVRASYYLISSSVHGLRIDFQMYLVRHLIPCVDRRMLYYLAVKMSFALVHFIAQ
jgi:hypothetical protein